MPTIAEMKQLTNVVMERFPSLTFALKEATVPGIVMEFGVFKGKSITHMAKVEPETTFYGFDSFEGLPEPWERGDSVLPAGHFKLDALPTVPNNVKLTKGFFDTTLEPWLVDNAQNIRLLHVDADLYSSAKYILEKLNDYIVPDTIIVFDEYCTWIPKPAQGKAYPAWEEGEYKAACEWQEAYEREITMIARNTTYGAIFRVTK